MSATYLVIGELDGNPDHEFGEYSSFADARNVWMAHDASESPVRIEKRDPSGVVQRVWVSGGGWADEVTA